MRHSDLVTTSFAYVRLLGDRHAIEEMTNTWDKTVVDRHHGTHRMDRHGGRAPFSGREGLHLRQQSLRGTLARDHMAIPRSDSPAPEETSPNRRLNAGAPSFRAAKGWGPPSAHREAILVVRTHECPSNILRRPRPCFSGLLLFACAIVERPATSVESSASGPVESTRFATDSAHRALHIDHAATSRHPKPSLHSGTGRARHSRGRRTALSRRSHGGKTKGLRKRHHGVPGRH